MVRMSTSANRSPARRRRGAEPRTGSALLELLVAMPLGLLLAALATQLFITQLQATRRVGSQLRNSRELEQAAVVLASALRGASATDVESWSDTNLVMHVAVLSGVLCGTPAPAVVDVVGERGQHPARSLLLDTPQRGDRVQAAASDSTLAGGEPAALDSAPQFAELAALTHAASACVDSPLRLATGAQPWRLALATALAAAPDPGSLVVVTRRTEWRSYRAADGLTYLGQREWDGVRWSTTQPVIGPLLANAAAGFQLRVLGASGAHAVSASEARVVEFSFRAPRMGTRVVGASPYDSLITRVALRGGA
jgi:hypothetical protein